MISPEFKTSIAEKNLLRTRIMLKDSFIIDPTFLQLEEMLSYAKINLPDVIVPYDGDYLEADYAKWSDETMNEELVQLVNNFSDMRVEHLKKVVSKILAKEAEIIRQKRRNQNELHNSAFRNLSSTSIRSICDTVVEAFASKELKKKEALKKMSAEARQVNKILCEVDANQNRWKSKNIDDLEQAAEKILQAVQVYKTNR